MSEDDHIKECVEDVFLEKCMNDLSREINDVLRTETHPIHMRQSVIFQIEIFKKRNNLNYKQILRLLKSMESGMVKFVLKQYMVKALYDD